MKPFTYISEPELDLGILGTHSATFYTFIDEDYKGGLQRKAVNITSVFIPLSQCECSVDIDITKEILNSPMARSEWEEEIFQAYKRATESAYEQVEG